MLTLRTVLTNELDHIETCIDELAEREAENFEIKHVDLKTYFVARAALHSRLASINELLGWINLMAEQGSEGNTFEAIKVLPALPVWSTNSWLEAKGLSFM